MTKQSSDDIFRLLLTHRGLRGSKLQSFLNPDYNAAHDPHLLPDIDKAVDRIIQAYNKQEKVLIYGDYDVDGITATTILVDAFRKLGIQNVSYVLPDRLSDGYGISSNFISSLATLAPDLIITVDCGSSNIAEINQIQSLGIDVIVTDHHEPKSTLPSALAIVNPKRSDSQYPFRNIAGVLVAFKLIQALQQRLPGIPDGQEKWFLDLVALGTICDVMEITDENRINVFFGLKVLAKTRRKGLSALMDIAGVNANKLTAESIGFQIGPRLNAAGRIDQATTALELLLETESSKAYTKANHLNDLNTTRKSMQDRAFHDIEVNSQDDNHPVLIIKHEDCHEGIIGIIASKLLEKHHKPTFVFCTCDDGLLKGSARSFGDFSLAEAIEHCQDLIIKGGGHKEAAGITLEPKNFEQFCCKIYNYYISLHLQPQEKHFIVTEDLAIRDLSTLSIDLYDQLLQLEPFGEGNPIPIFKLENVTIIHASWVGNESNHLKMTAIDDNGEEIKLFAFLAPTHWYLSPDTRADIWITLGLNEWNNARYTEGKILQIKPCE